MNSSAEPAAAFRITSAGFRNFLTEKVTDETKHRDQESVIDAAHKMGRALSQYVSEIALLIYPNAELHRKLYWSS